VRSEEEGGGREIESKRRGDREWEEGERGE
jgi:hypothetical protein